MGRTGGSGEDRVRERLSQLSVFAAGNLAIDSEFEMLKALNGMEGILLISRSGEVFWSWHSPGIRLNIRTMRLVEMIKSIIPTMLNMPDIGVQRSLFQFDHENELLSMYFTNVAEHAFICCILGSRFDYINVTDEISKAAFILCKKLSRQDIDQDEMDLYLKEVHSRTSYSISSSVNQFSRITKRRSRGSGGK